MGPDKQLRLLEFPAPSIAVVAIFSSSFEAESEAGPHVLSRNSNVDGFCSSDDYIQLRELRRC